MAKTPGAINKSLTKKERAKSAVVDARQKVFADTLLEGHSQSTAARAAGYHPASASNVMRQEEVQQYLTEARREVGEVTTIKRLDVMNIFLEAIDMARTLADPSQMINGADKLAKMMGFYAPETMKLEIEHSSKALSAKFKGLSDAELLEIASGQARVIEGEVVREPSETLQ